MTWILTGDIGGTKTRLALLAAEDLRLGREKVYASADYGDFAALLADFLRGQDVPAVLSLGIAGPIQGRVVQTTNLPWRIDADELQARFGFAACHLLNDLEVVAWSLPVLQDCDVRVLQVGVEQAGNRAVIAAGTGLGEAGLFWDGQRHQPFATEGGHTSFTPTDAVEFDLLQQLQTEFGHVSWERVVSGMGIVSLYRFLRARSGVAEPDWLQAELATQDVGAVVSRAAAAGSDAVCVETLRRFACLYGAEAGNLALKVMSRGGLYLGGGIAPKILPWLESGLFMQAFLHKGRMRHLLEAMPVKVILNERAGLLGAAHFARQAG